MFLSKFRKLSLVATILSTPLLSHCNYETATTSAESGETITYQVSVATEQDRSAFSATLQAPTQNPQNSTLAAYTIRIDSCSSGLFYDLDQNSSTVSIPTTDTGCVAKLNKFVEEYVVDGVTYRLDFHPFRDQDNWNESTPVRYELRGITADAGNGGPPTVLPVPTEQYSSTALRSAIVVATIGGSSTDPRIAFAIPRINEQGAEVIFETNPSNEFNISVAQTISGSLERLPFQIDTNQSPVTGYEPPGRRVIELWESTYGQDPGHTGASHARMQLRITCMDRTSFLSGLQPAAAYETLYARLCEETNEAVLTGTLGSVLYVIAPVPLSGDMITPHQASTMVDASNPWNAQPFQRAALSVAEPAQAGTDSSGNPTTTPAILQTEVFSATDYATVESKMMLIIRISDTIVNDIFRTDVSSDPSITHQQHGYMMQRFTLPANSGVQ